VPVLVSHPGRAGSQSAKSGSQPAAHAPAWQLALWCSAVGQGSHVTAAQPVSGSFVGTVTPLHVFVGELLLPLLPLLSLPPPPPSFVKSVGAEGVGSSPTHATAMTTVPKAPIPKDALLIAAEACRRVRECLGFASG
jgi:hypothetical protein